MNLNFLATKLERLVWQIQHWPDLDFLQSLGVILGSLLFVGNCLIAIRSQVWGERLLQQALRLLRQGIKTFVQDEKILTEASVVPWAITIQAVLQSPAITSAMIQAELRRASLEADPIFGERARFTVFSPRRVKPEHWYPLLAVAHIAEPREEEGFEGLIGPVAEEVSRLAQAVLTEHRTEAYQHSTSAGEARVPHTGTVTFWPDVPNVEFLPSSASFQWYAAIHWKSFHLRAASRLEGGSTAGRVTVYCGPIVIGEVPVRLQVGGSEPDVHQSLEIVEGSRQPYRKIFASYSLKDAKIVDMVKSFARLLGDTYLQDSIDLRAGEVWGQRLREMIAEADIFQLFWSSNSMHSPFVQKEWEYALSLGRPAFVRPTYWEEPLPANPQRDLPPRELSRLHFQKIPLELLTREYPSNSSPIPTERSGERRKGAMTFLTAIAQRLARREPPLMSISATNPMYGFVLSIVGFGALLLTLQVATTGPGFAANSNRSMIFWSALVAQAGMLWLVRNAGLFWRQRYGLLQEHGSLVALPHGRIRLRDLFIYLGRIESLKSLGAHVLWAPLWEGIVFFVLPYNSLQFLVVLLCVRLPGLVDSGGGLSSSTIKVLATVFFAVQIYIGIYLFVRCHEYKYFRKRSLRRQLEVTKREILIARVERRDLTRLIREYQRVCRELWVLSGREMYRELERSAERWFS